MTQALMPEMIRVSSTNSISRDTCITRGNYRVVQLYWTMGEGVEAFMADGFKFKVFPTEVEDPGFGVKIKLNSTTGGLANGKQVPSTGGNIEGI